MPSTVSRWVSMPFASSTVITPSLPTFSIASAIRFPISESLFAEIAPTCAISFLPFVGVEICFSPSTTFTTAFSIPRLIAIGFAPAVTFLSPSRKIACASTVAVVVPSPARSLVLVATSFTICAPMFSIGSRSSTSFATVTPSFVTVGAPNFRSRTTFRPFGPNVTFTACASWSTPRFNAARASVLNCSSLAAISVYLRVVSLFDDREHIRLAQDQVLLITDIDLGAAVLAVQDLVAGLYLRRDPLPVIRHLPRTYRHHLALLGLFLRSVRDVQATTHGFGVLERLDDDPIRQWADLGRRSSRHRAFLQVVSGCVI